jgi:hypothetical protein
MHEKQATKFASVSEEMSKTLAPSMTSLATSDTYMLQARLL